MPKSLQIENGVIHANGRKIKQLERLSIGRFQALEDLRLRMQYGNELPQFSKTIKQVRKDLNSLQFADGSAKLVKLDDAIDEHLKKAAHPLLLVGTVFLCEEGKDDAVWNEPEANELIEHLVKEGLDVEDFFLFSKTRFLAFTNRLNGGFDVFSEKAETKD